MQFDKIIRVLEESYPVQVWSARFTPFEVLVAVILSQATERRNNMRAFENLRKRFDVTPEAIANADLNELVECIRPAGLQNVKAPRIKEVARIIVDQYHGDLNEIMRLPQDEARDRLLALPGVGAKTADVMLNFVAGRDTLPIDTHITRIAKRLGLVREKSSYEEIKTALEGLVPPEDRQKAHLTLIEFGRNVCKAQNPRCDVCPISKYCREK